MAELDDAAAILQAAADGYRESTLDQDARGNRDTPSPSPTADDLDELESILSKWEQEYRTLMQWSSGAPRGFLATRLTTGINWLGHHLDGILCAPFAERFGEDVLRCHREFAGKARAGVRRLRKPLRCPSCHLLTLTWVEGEHQVECGNPACHRILALSEYEAEVGRRIGAA